MGPHQIYDVKGEPWLYVGSETRGGERVAHFVGAAHGVVFHRYTEALPEEAVLINDTDGRREADTAWRMCQALEQERDILNEVLREAVKLMTDTEAERLRKLFLAKMDTKEVFLKCR